MARTSSILLPLLILLGAFTSSASSSSASASSAAENLTLSALLHFKAGIEGDPHGVLSSWRTSSHFCDWHGVSCEGRGPQVNFLNLAHASLSGTLSPYLGNVQGLSRLELPHNSFTGVVPTQLSNLAPSLKCLDLSHNRLSGPLPSSLGQTRSLFLLDLSHNHLSGPLPSSLGLLKSLLDLNLSQNHLSGLLPSAFAQMKNLEQLDLSGNQLSGPLPSSLGLMRSLQQLNLSQNQLSGGLPSSLGLMKNLTYLDLSQNQLSGFLPSSLGSSDQLLFLNVSNNQLRGKIPRVGIYQTFAAASFLGNPGLYGLPLITTCPSLSTTNINPHSKKSRLLVPVCVVGAISLLASLLYALWYFFHKRGQLGPDFVVPQYKAWTAEEMRIATNDFNVANVIGSGAVSMCYFGMMEIPQGIKVVAFKRLIVDDHNEGQDDEARECFVNEIKTLCKMRHRNLVKMLGYCVEGSEAAMVMEYMEKGDLDRKLHTLSWEERVNVALDVAEGLVYLHHEYGEPIIHCDLKPKNILLSSDMVAKISDFGLAKLLEANDIGEKTMSKLRGTFGYIAPECGMGLKISTKADVYSYGILLLELVTGVRPTSPMLDEEVISLRTWVERLLAFGRIKEELRCNNVIILQEAEKLLRLAIHCSHDVAKERPTMYTVRDSIIQLKNKRQSGILS